MPHPTFRLFRSTSPVNRCQYVGALVLPDGRYFAIEANVVTHDCGGGKTGKHFEGEVFEGARAVQAMLRSAKADGSVPDDLIALMNADFDDPLPGDL
jgi:hypothetical protein